MDGPLNLDQVARFQRDGYLVCADLLATQHEVVERWVEEIAGWPDSADRWHHYRELTEFGPVLARTENFMPHHDSMRRLLTSGPLCEAVSQLFGQQAMVFKEKLNYKHPGGGGFAPHQDASAYKFGDVHITALAAIDDNNTANGCLYFAPGRHQQGLLPRGPDGCLTPDFAESLHWVAAPVPPGGVVFFHSFLPHQSSANNSPNSRRSLYVTYTQAAEGDLRQAYYDDRRRAMVDHQQESPPLAGAQNVGRISTIGHFQGKVIHS